MYDLYIDAETLFETFMVDDYEEVFESYYESLEEGKAFQLKIGAKNVLTSGKPQHDGDFSKLQRNLMGYVKSCKSIEDCNYLLSDARRGIKQLEKLKDNLNNYKSGNKKSNVNEKDMEKRINKGLTAKKIDSHIKWINTNYIPAINSKKQELRK